MKKTLALAGMLALTMSAAPSAFAETIVSKDANGNVTRTEIGGDQNPLVTGITSALLPGWGQGINGDWIKGGLHFAGIFAVGYASGLLFPTNAGAQFGMAWAYKTLSGLEAISTTNSMNAEHLALRNSLMGHALPSLDVATAPVRSDWHLSQR